MSEQPVFVKRYWYKVESRPELFIYMEHDVIFDGCCYQKNTDRCLLLSMFR